MSVSAQWLPARWEANLSTLKIPEALSEWIQCTTSITDRAKKYAGHIEIELLNHEWTLKTFEETYPYVIKTEPLFLREIYMRCDDVPWWYARTLIPKTTYHLRQSRLDALGACPLGDLLYHDPLIVRTPFEYSALSPSTPEYKQALSHLPLCSGIDLLWARRSIFWIEKKPLFLMEVFLPTLLKALTCTDV